MLMIAVLWEQYMARGKKGLACETLNPDLISCRENT